MIAHSKAAFHVASWCISLGAGMLAIVLNESTGFSLGVICAVFSGVWWLGRKLQNLEDRLDRGDKEREEILAFIKNLPCNVLHVCKPPEQK